MPDELTPNDRSSAPDCSALDDALRLLSKMPRRETDSEEWWNAATAMTKHCKGRECVDEAAARIINDSREWNRQRLALLASVQKHMRYPERQLVCDILANGQLLPDPNGKRYGFAASGNEHLSLPNAAMEATGLRKSQPTDNNEH